MRNSCKHIDIGISQSFESFDNNEMPGIAMHAPFMVGERHTTTNCISEMDCIRLVLIFTISEFRCLHAQTYRLAIIVCPTEHSRASSPTHKWVEAQRV